MGVNQVPPTTPDYITAINNFEADKHFLKVVQDKKTGSETITLVKKNIFTRIARAWSNFCDNQNNSYNFERIAGVFTKKVIEIKNGIESKLKNENDTTDLKKMTQQDLEKMNEITSCIWGNGFDAIKKQADKRTEQCKNQAGRYQENHFATGETEQKNFPVQDYIESLKSNFSKYYQHNLLNSN